MTDSPLRAFARGTTVLVGTVGLMLASTATDAKTIYNTDTRGDVIQYFDPEGPVAVPDQVDGDVVQTRLWHATQLGVRVTFAQLSHLGSTFATTPCSSSPTKVYAARCW